MKKLIREKDYKKIKYFRLIFSLMFSILIILGIVQVIMANQLVEKGEKIKTLNNKIEIITKENQELKELISSETSLEKIKEKAKNLGMIELTSIIYLSTPLPIALNQ